MPVSYFPRFEGDPGSKIIMILCLVSLLECAGNAIYYLSFCCRAVASSQQRFSPSSCGMTLMGGKVNDFPVYFTASLVCLATPRVSIAQLFSYIMRKGELNWACAPVCHEYEGVLPNILQCGCNRHALVSVCLTYKALAIWKNLWVLSCAHHFWHHSNGNNHCHILLIILVACYYEFFDVWLGFRELHFGAHTNATPAQLPWRVLLLLLCVHCCPQVFFLSGPNAYR